MKRVLMVGCSHGRYCDKHSIAAVENAARKLKPHLIIHLGDWCDATALRSGAKGSNDECVPIQPDIDGGLEFIGSLRGLCKEMWVFDGNHDYRATRLASSHKACEAELGRQLVDMIEARMEKLRVRHIPYRGIWEHRRLGNYVLMHGSGMGGMNALRQHTAVYGNCVIAHIHAATLETSQRIEGATGFSVGTLADIEKLEYANTRFNTLRWSAGFVWGEYNEKLAQLWLHQQPRANKTWVLPF